MSLLVSIISDYDDKSIVLQEILKGEITKIEGKGKSNSPKTYKSDLFDLERIQEKFFSDKYWLHRDKNEEAENLKSELDELENLI
nr:hypothetical protein [Mycoplasmopsis bovis]